MFKLIDSYSGSRFELINKNGKLFLKKKFKKPTQREIFSLTKQNNYKNLRKVWKVHGDEEIDAYLNVFRQRGALRSALNWYRANIGNRRKPSDYIQFGNVSVPTLFIWGNMDMAIGRKSVELSEKYMKGPYTFIELYAGHWLIQEEFDKVSNEMIKHIGKYSSSFYEPHLGRKK